MWLVQRVTFSYSGERMMIMIRGRRVGTGKYQPRLPNWGGKQVCWYEALPVKLLFTKFRLIVGGWRTGNSKITFASELVNPSVMSPSVENMATSNGLDIIVGAIQLLAPQRFR